MADRSQQLQLAAEGCAKLRSLARERLSFLFDLGEQGCGLGRDASE